MSKTIIYTRTSAMETSNSDSGTIPWDTVGALAIDINVTDRQGTSPTLAITLYRLGSDNTTWFPIWEVAAFSVSSANVTPIQKSVSIGPGCSYPEVIASSGKLAWTIGGTSTPGAKFSISIIGE